MRENNNALLGGRTSECTHEEGLLTLQQRRVIPQIRFHVPVAMSACCDSQFPPAEKTGQESAARSFPAPRQAPSVVPISHRWGPGRDRCRCAAAIPRPPPGARLPLCTRLPAPARSKLCWPLPLGRTTPPCDRAKTHRMRELVVENRSTDTLTDSSVRGQNPPGRESAGPSSPRRPPTPLQRSTLAMAPAPNEATVHHECLIP
jgi:hypothetical protein